ncbi:MAG: PilC/PilY family type IV pilus protein [Pseudomonadota bacterium]
MKPTSTPVLRTGGVGLVTGIVLATHVHLVAHAAPPVVNLPPGPVSRTLVHPNVLLDLSVEYPTAGSAYKGEYDTNREYFGYFDPSQCYVYQGGKSTYSGGKYDTSDDGKKYFVPAGPASPTDHKCKKQFSGNFMNWATASAIDMLRLGLTGGNRVIDEVGKTVLERAYLRDEMYANPILFSYKEVGTGKAKMDANPDEVTPFSNKAIYAVSCRNRVLFSTSKPTAEADFGYTLCDQSGGPDKNLGEFVVRVQVCTEAERSSRSELCKPFPANNTAAGELKPVGEIQRRANEFYFGAMGYLLKDGPEAYGGVLRARLGHVGPFRYDEKLRRFNNASKEWREDTGIFTNVEGVVNYLNKFGSNGIYKRNDPVSELYYESLRYLRGLEPSPEATASMSSPQSAEYAKWRYCAAEGGTCTLPAGTWEVRYGENNKYVTRFSSSSIGCNNGVFGDPILGTVKHCDIRPVHDVTEGFPVIRPWKNKDPIVSSCQRNAIILVADANANFDFSIPGNTQTIYTSGNPAKVADSPKPGADGENLVTPLNARDWANKVGASEVNNVKGTKLKDALGDQKNGWRDQPPNEQSHKGSYYVSGLAYWANTSQMREDKKNIHAKTFVIDVDERGNGAINNTKREFFAPRDSQLYLAAKYGGYDAFASDDYVHATPRGPYTPGPNPTNAQTKCDSYLWDKNGDCDPENYFLASDGVRMVEAIHNIMEQVSIPGESVNSVSTTSSAVTPGETQYIYQASGNPQGGWSGDVVRAEVTVDDTGNVAIKPFSPSETAARNLTDWSNRNILMMNRKNFPDPNRSTVPFLWDNLSPFQQALLSGRQPTYGPKRLNFLRGSTVDEISERNIDGLFRRRPSPAGVPNVLGDVINSSPVYVGAPRIDILDKSYEAWRKTNAKRTPAVYVGANDGMLHAFSKDLKKEYFAYVPNLIFDKLRDLTKRDYLHKPTVDGGIVVTEANTGKRGWKTVLVGGLGAGAQGVYALDVTDPDDFDKKNGVLWEFGDVHDKDMGNVFSAPNVAKFVSQIDKNGVPVYHYYAVVPSGVNHYAPDANTGDDAKGGALFLLSLQKPFEAPWVAHPGAAKGGSPNYHKITIGLSVDTLQSGLSAPALVTGPDGAVRYAYAGDLQGNLWRFDFTKPLNGARTAPRIIFTAMTKDKVRQPITAAPKVVFAEGGGFVVLFGTGKYLEDSDLLNLGQHSFYGIYDEPTNASYKVASRASLQERTINGNASAKTLAVVGEDFVYYNMDRNNKEAKKGWYVDFLQPDDPIGERNTTTAQLDFGKVFFNTLIPPTDICEPKINGRSYILNALTGLTDGGSGSSTGQLTAVGALSTPVVFATNENNPGAANSIGKSTVSRTFSVLAVGKESLTAGLKNEQKSAGNIKKVISLTNGRMSWREVLNYKELHDERKP